MAKFDVKKPYYVILGITNNATTNEIFDAYNKLKLELHPDNHDSYKESFEEVMKNVQEAFDVLSNPVLRAEYDEARKAIPVIPVKQPDPIKVVKVDDSTKAKTTAAKGRQKESHLTAKGIAFLVALALMLTTFGYCTRKDKDGGKDKDSTTTSSSSSTTGDDDLDDLLNEFTFVDPKDEDQLNKRAEILHAMFVKAGINDYTVEDIKNQLKFINSTYQSKTEDESYDMANSILELMGKYGTSVKGVTNFAGEELDMNDVESAVKLSAYIVDNSPNADILNDFATQFIQTVTGSTREDIKVSSEKLLTTQAELMVGTYVNSKGKQVAYFELNDAEQFIIGLMSQIIAPAIKTSLGETFSVNVGPDKKASINITQDYYNPMCDGEYDTSNVWARAYNGLVVASLNNNDQQLTLKK